METAGAGAAEEGATGAAWRVSQQRHADLGLADAPPLRLALVHQSRETRERGVPTNPTKRHGVHEERAVLLLLDPSLRPLHSSRRARDDDRARVRLPRVGVRV